MCFFISPRCLGVRANPNQINDGGDKLNTKVTLKSVCCLKVLFLFLAAHLAATFGLGKMVIHAVSAPPFAFHYGYRLSLHVHWLLVQLTDVRCERASYVSHTCVKVEVRQREHTASGSGVLERRPKKSRERK